ncbi:protein FAM161A-like isoform X2 [Liolophura sinensis]|uniref:protein FAM161A-like isoform X2 n=1 Tax=Liolophura sinensis TaxID=3198878 RepID=UPI003158BF41
MATVAAASTGHGLAVLTNACVKQPSRSRSKLKATSSTKSAPSKGGFIGTRTVNFDDELPSEMSKTEDDVSRWADMTDFDTWQPDDQTGDLGALSSDEFYQRLLQLKNEHKKTLQMCERLYRQKLSEEVDRSEDLEWCLSEDDVVNGHVFKDLAHGHDEDTGAQNGSRDLSTKPPLVRQNKLRSSHHSIRTRPSSAPIRRQSLSRSLDADDWRLMQHNGQLLQEETQSEIYDPRESAAAMERIQDMWEEFSVDDYAPRKRKPRRPSSAHSSTPSEKKRPEKDWRHRITIPKPFQMTLREANKEKTKSKAQIIHEDELLRKQQEEEAECQKKFKAAPVPAHVYLPLFEEYNEKKEARRRYVKDYRKELLKSIEKPFKFMSREQEKKQRNLDKAWHQSDGYEHSKTFKAKPVPSYVYETAPNEKILENEEYRQIRIKMRAEELMRSAALPPNMEARQKIKEQKLKEQKGRKKTSKKRFVPRINSDVPDYDELYRQFQKELQKRKLEREATVTEPFKLRTGNIPSKKDKIINDMEKDMETLRENRWPFRNPRMTPRKSFVSSTNMSTSLDSIPHRMTSSAEMRFHRGRDKARTLTQKDLEELEYRRRQRQKEAKLRQAIIEKTLANEEDRLSRPTREAKLKEYRESDRARMAEYKQSLEDIKQRVNERPLLFEQVKQANAKKAAEKRYSQTLRDHGLDETYVQQKSSLSTGVDTDADDLDMGETSYKGMEDSENEDRTYANHSRDEEASM